MASTTRPQNLQMNHDSTFLETPAQADLHTCLRDGQSGAFLSRAARQLLGDLAKPLQDPLPVAIAKALQFKSRGTHMFDVDALGNPCLESMSPKANDLWSALQRVYTTAVENNATRELTGRGIRIRSLTPIVALQLLASLSKHFDVEQLFSVLIGSGYSSGYIHHPVPGVVAKSFWYFSLKYYYLNLGPPNGHDGQVANVFHENEDDLFICRGSSLIAVSGGLDSTPGRVEPWTLLVVSCNEHSYKSAPQLKDVVEAFFWAVEEEMASARRSLRNVSNHISSLAVPSDKFLFDRGLQDALLFEDESFTNTRMYFWALQSLRAINEAITSIISAWENYDMVSLFEYADRIEKEKQPGPELLLVNTLPRLSQKSMRDEIAKFKELIKANNAKQEEIRSLRDGVFNASSVLEARTAIMQGKNIQLLTYISLIFLPASFVTSVFSMGSILPETLDIKSFAITFTLICGVTYITILVAARGAVSKLSKKVRARRARLMTAQDIKMNG